MPSMSTDTRSERFYQTLQSWASVAPLIACIMGPLSILLGIPALTQRWRGYVMDNVVISTLPDPQLNIVLACLSLVCEVFANALLMLRFSSIAVTLTTRLSLALWILKVVFSLGNYVQFIIVHPQPKLADEMNWTYLEGFWIGCASMVISGIVIIFLILNLTISPRKHEFSIFENAIMEQHRLAHRGFMIRVLILVLAMGFGSLAFCKLEAISFVTALYFVTASILTVGFGDVALQSPAAKVILFPYLVFSITYVALLVTSIAGLIDERLDAQRQLREHLKQLNGTSEKQRPLQMHHALVNSGLIGVPQSSNKSENVVTGQPDQFSSESVDATLSATSKAAKGSDPIIEVEDDKTDTFGSILPPFERTMTLQEEIELQAGSLAKIAHKRQIRNIFLALLFFAIFWFIGAIVFAYSEGWAYGEALYFCYVFFMTVGYGDYSAKSQLGRVLFIVYAMIAVPTVTFLVQVFVEAADVSKYVYNSKKSRQRRINELDTRDLDEIKKQLTREQTEKGLIGLQRSRSSVPGIAGTISRSRTLSRSVTMENDRSIILTQKIQYENHPSPRTGRSRALSCALSESPFDSASTTDEVQDDKSSVTSDQETNDDEGAASQVLQAEITARSRLLQNARKLDHLTRLLISPHLHHEARLLLSLEMGRMDGHYKQMLRRLSQSQAGLSSSARDWMEDTREAEWLGLTGLERERKFVVEYRECFASLMNDVEILVSDVTPITSEVTAPRNVLEVREEPVARNEDRIGITWAH